MIVNIIQPTHGKILDPACDSGGMFVSSGDFVNANGRIKYLCKKYLTDIISSI